MPRVSGGTSSAPVAVVRILRIRMTRIRRTVTVGPRRRVVGRGLSVANAANCPAVVYLPLRAGRPIFLAIQKLFYIATIVWGEIYLSLSPNSDY